MKLRRIIYYLIILILIFTIYSSLKTTNKFRNSIKRVDVARVKLEKLEAEKAQIEAKIKEAESEEFVERQIRDKLGLVKEGEIVVIMPPDDIVKKYALKASEETSEPEKPNWKKWMGLFF